MNIMGGILIQGNDNINYNCMGVIFHEGTCGGFWKGEEGLIRWIGGEFKDSFPWAVDGGILGDNCAL